MNKYRILALSVLSALSVQANAVETTATVIRSEPIYQRVDTPRQRCVTEQVTQQVPVRGRSSERNVASSVLGGLTGALIGSQVGGGNGNKVAIAAGAIGGAMIGDEMGRQTDGGYTTQTTPVEHCSTVSDYHEQVSGYRVTYSYAGMEYETTMRSRPGRQIPVDVQVTPRQY